MSQLTSPHAHENTYYQLLTSSGTTKLAFPGPWETDRQCPDGHKPMGWTPPCGDTLTLAVLVSQLCLTLFNPIDCLPPGSSVHGILQARILEWVAFPFSRGSSQLRVQTQVSDTAGRFFATWASREAQEHWSRWSIPSPGDFPWGLLHCRQTLHQGSIGKAPS